MVILKFKLKYYYLSDVLCSFFIYRRKPLRENNITALLTIVYLRFVYLALKLLEKKKKKKQ